MSPRALKHLQARHGHTLNHCDNQLRRLLVGHQKVRPRVEAFDVWLDERLRTMSAKP